MADLSLDKQMLLEVIKKRTKTNSKKVGPRLNEREWHRPPGESLIKELAKSYCFGGQPPGGPVGFIKPGVGMTRYYENGFERLLRPEFNMAANAFLPAAAGRLTRREGRREIISEFTSYTVYRA